MLDQIEELLHRFFYDRQSGLWAKYQRQLFSQYDIPINDMGNSVKTDANGNAEFVVYENSTGRDLAISRLQLWGDGYTPDRKSVV